MTDDARARLLVLVEPLVRSLFTNGQGVRADRLVLTKDGVPSVDLGGWCEGAVVDRIADALAAVLAAEDVRTCEFCQQPDGDPPAMLDVCPACWTRANDGSGWMQRALKAEAELTALTPARRALAQAVQAVDMCRTNTRAALPPWAVKQLVKAARQVIAALPQEPPPDATRHPEP